MATRDDKSASDRSVAAESRQQTVAIIGSGTMGRGIAAVALQSGFRVHVFDTDAERAGDAADHAIRALETSEVQGAKDAAEQRIQTFTELSEAVRDADEIIECVPELFDLKVEVLGAVAKAKSAQALLATNTSTMSIGALADAAGCPDELVGMHFFNPPERMRLVELVRSPSVLQARVDQAIELAEALGKSVVLINDSPGFVTSRLGLILGNEAMRLVEEGVAAPSDIDTAMRLGYNHPMGPLELADLVGLDARLNNFRAVYGALKADRFEPPQILVRLVEAGQFGRKSGRGFYEYDQQGHKTRDAIGRDA